MSPCFSSIYVLLTELQVKLDETEQMALRGGKKQLHKLETTVSENSVTELFLTVS